MPGKPSSSVRSKIEALKKKKAAAEARAEALLPSLDKISPGVPAHERHKAFMQQAHAYNDALADVYSLNRQLQNLRSNKGRLGDPISEGSMRATAANTGRKK